jgi:hypothetical protein
MALFTTQPLPIVRQEIHYISRARVVDLPHGQKPYRIWVLPLRASAPPLPFVGSADVYREEFLHDWAWVRCGLRGVCYVLYYGRCAPLGNVWAVFEYAGDP